MDTVTTGPAGTEILLEILTGGQPLSPDVAQWLLTLKFTEKQQSRMLNLAERGNEGSLLPGEREEMCRFADVGDLLSILHSKARMALREVVRSA
jgi:hypothetical protein